MSVLLGHTQLKEHHKCARETYEYEPCQLIGTGTENWPGQRNENEKWEWKFEQKLLKTKLNRI